MYLGIFGPGPNPSACFVKDGKVLFWAEEERFTRIKTSPNSFPYKSIYEGFKRLNIGPSDIKGIGYAWDCVNYKVDSANNLLSTARAYPSEMDHLNLLANERINIVYDSAIIEFNIKKIFGAESLTEIPPIKFFDHHLCHAASCIPLLPDHDSVIITNDGSGGIISTAIHIFKEGKILPSIGSVCLPHTLGGIYASMTEYLGYRAYEDEGRVMGLACYGEYDKGLMADFSNIMRSTSPESGFYFTDPTFRYNHKRTYGSRYSDKLVELLGLPRRSNESPMGRRFKNIAFSLQFSLEHILLNICDWSRRESGMANALFAGGVHMNCKANGVIIKSKIFDKCLFQPAASDNGVSLGAAYLIENDIEEGSNLSRISPMQHLYHGTEYSDTEIESYLKKSKVNYRRTDSVARDAAMSIHTGKILGWFQGRMEVGARALGGRSILASPLNPEARDLVNVNVKNREPWRPFCPSIKAESINSYIRLEGSVTNPNFMITAHGVQDEMIKEIPSCVHIDKTARPQSVSKEVNSIYWELLDELEKLSGHPIVLNTSFNVKGEPIVQSPEEAIRCFFGTGIDELYIGNFVVSK